METILNIYIIVNDGRVRKFKAKSYQAEGTDREKIDFLQSKVHSDLSAAKEFDAPVSSTGSYMTYSKFAKLEERGMQKDLYGAIFEAFDLPDNPLICVTPVVDGKIIMNKLF